MARQYVKPYLKTNKNDLADAEAICEAVTQPNMLCSDQDPLKDEPSSLCIGVAKDPPV